MPTPEQERKAYLGGLQIAVRRSNLNLLKTCFLKLWKTREGRDVLLEGLPLITAEDAWPYLPLWAKMTLSSRGEEPDKLAPIIMRFLRDVAVNLKSQDAYWLHRLCLKVPVTFSQHPEFRKMWMIANTKQSPSFSEELTSKVEAALAWVHFPQSKEVAVLMRDTLMRGMPVSKAWITLQLIASRRAPVQAEFDSDVKRRLVELADKIEQNPKVLPDLPWYAWTPGSGVYEKATLMMSKYYHKAHTWFPRDLISTTNLMVMEHTLCKWQMDMPEPNRLDDWNWYHCVWRQTAMRKIIPYAGISLEALMKKWTKDGRRLAKEAFVWARRYA